VIDCLEHNNALQIVCLHVLQGEIVVLDVLDLAVGDLDGLLGAHGAGVGAHAVDGHHVLESLGDLAEGDVLLVQEPGGADGEEELGAVGVLAAVGHGDDAAGGVGDDEVLVVEGGAVDAGAAAALLVEDVAAVEKHVLDDAVAVGVLVADLLQLGPLESVAESLEVKSGDWGGVAEDSDGDLALEVVVAVVVLDLDVKHGLGGDGEVAVGGAQGGHGGQRGHKQQHGGFMCELRWVNRPTMMGQESKWPRKG